VKTGYWHWETSEPANCSRGNSNGHNIAKSLSTLYSLAAGAGGKAFFDDNDLTLGVTRAQKTISNYYLIGCYTTNTAENGRFRRIKITLPEMLKCES
jgi:hypothetical protein